MEYGDIVVVNEPRHPFFNYVGKIVGKRGQRTPEDILMLVLINYKSYIIPESMLSMYQPGQDNN